jgi:hypothetical protein
MRGSAYWKERRTRGTRTDRAKQVEEANKEEDVEVEAEEEEEAKSAVCVFRRRNAPAGMACTQPLKLPCLLLRKAGSGRFLVDDVNQGDPLELR